MEETKDRNEYSDKNPAAVYVVTYTYENIGYVDEDGIMDGMYVSIEDGIVDSTGKMGYSYPGDVTKYVQSVPVGAFCEAQACIGVDTPGSFRMTRVSYTLPVTKKKPRWCAGEERYLFHAGGSDAGYC